MSLCAFHLEQIYLTVLAQVDHDVNMVTLPEPQYGAYFLKMTTPKNSALVECGQLRFPPIKPGLPC